MPAVQPESLSVQRKAGGLRDANGVTQWRPSHCNALAGAGWDLKGDAVLLSSDALGLAPIYVADGKTVSTVANTVFGAAEGAGCWAFDDDAMAVFVRFGSFIGNDTPFANVRAVPPGFDGLWDGTALDDVWHQPAPPAFTGSREEAREIYQQLFGKAVRAMAQDAGPLHLPLSGGRDSRHILLALDAQKVPVAQTYTVASYADEVTAAKVLTDRLGLSNTVAQLSAIDMFKSRPIKHAALDYMSLQHRVAYRLGQMMQGASGTVFDGLGGDVLSNGLFFSQSLCACLQDGRHEEAADMLLGPESRLAWMNAPLKARWSRARAVAHFARFLKPFEASPNPVQDLFLWSRTRREISLAPLRLFPAGMMVALPYMDPPLVTFLRSLPADRFGAPGFHDEVIAKAYPGFADVPYEAKSEPPRWNAWHRARFYCAAWARTLRGICPSAKPVYVLPRLLKATGTLQSPDNLSYLEKTLFFADLVRLAEARSPG